jgi:hypothetical protein
MIGVMQGPMPGGRQVPNPCPAVLPDVRDIFPMRPKSGGQPTGDLSAARALMKQVEESPVSWHRQVVLQQQEASA